MFAEGETEGGPTVPPQSRVPRSSVKSCEDTGNCMLTEVAADVNPLLINPVPRSNHGGSAQGEATMLAQKSFDPEPFHGGSAFAAKAGTLSDDEEEDKMDGDRSYNARNAQPSAREARWQQSAAPLSHRNSIEDLFSILLGAGSVVPGTPCANLFAQHLSSPAHGAGGTMQQQHGGAQDSPPPPSDPARAQGSPFQQEASEHQQQFLQQHQHLSPVTPSPINSLDSNMLPDIPRLLQTLGSYSRPYGVGLVPPDVISAQLVFASLASGAGPAPQPSSAPAHAQPNANDTAAAATAARPQSALLQEQASGSGSGAVPAAAEDGLRGAAAAALTASPSRESAQPQPQQWQQAAVGGLALGRQDSVRSQERSGQSLAAASLAPAQAHPGQYRQQSPREQLPHAGAMLHFQQRQQPMRQQQQQQQAYGLDNTTALRVHRLGDLQAPSPQHQAQAHSPLPLVSAMSGQHSGALPDAAAAAVGALRTADDTHGDGSRKSQPVAGAMSSTPCLADTSREARQSCTGNNDDLIAAMAASGMDASSGLGSGGAEQRSGAGTRGSCSGAAAFGDDNAPATPLPGAGPCAPPFSGQMAAPAPQQHPQPQPQPGSFSMWPSQSQGAGSLPPGAYTQQQRQMQQQQQQQQSQAPSLHWQAPHHAAAGRQGMAQGGSAPSSCQGPQLQLQSQQRQQMATYPSAGSMTAAGSAATLGRSASGSLEAFSAPGLFGIEGATLHREAHLTSPFALATHLHPQIMSATAAPSAGPDAAGAHPPSFRRWTDGGGYGLPFHGKEQDQPRFARISEGYPARGDIASGNAVPAAAAAAHAGAATHPGDMIRGFTGSGSGGGSSAAALSASCGLTGLTLGTSTHGSTVCGSLGGASLADSMEGNAPASMGTGPCGALAGGNLAAGGGSGGSGGSLKRSRMPPARVPSQRTYATGEEEASSDEEGDTRTGGGAGGSPLPGNWRPEDLPPPVAVTVTGLSRDVGEDGRRRRVTVQGMFHPDRYLANQDCILYENKFISRSGFEKVGGSTTAKWHCSIKIAGTNSTTLGNWLTARGLPVLKGGTRKSKRQRASEMSQQAAAQQATGPLARPPPSPSPSAPQQPRLSTGSAAPATSFTSMAVTPQASPPTPRTSNPSGLGVVPASIGSSLPSWALPNLQAQSQPPHSGMMQAGGPAAGFGAAWQPQQAGRDFGGAGTAPPSPVPLQPTGPAAAAAPGGRSAALQPQMPLAPPPIYPQRGQQLATQPRGGQSPGGFGVEVGSMGGAMVSAVTLAPYNAPQHHYQQQQQHVQQLQQQQAPSPYAQYGFGTQPYGGSSSTAGALLRSRSGSGSGVSGDAGGGGGQVAEVYGVDSGRHLAAQAMKVPSGPALAGSALSQPQPRYPQLPPHFGPSGELRIPGPQQGTFGSYGRPTWGAGAGGSGDNRPRVETGTRILPLPLPLVHSPMPGQMDPSQGARR